MYAQLGDIIFEGLLGATSHELTTSANYAEHPLINGKPRIQSTGSGLDRLKIGMMLHINFCTPEEIIIRLNRYRSQSAVLRYVNGVGRYLGTFVIAGIKQTDEQWGPNGRLMQTSLEIDLLEDFVADAQSQAIADAIKAGFAMSNNTPVETVARITPLTAVAIASKKTTTIAASNTNVDIELKKATGDAGDAAFYLNKVKTNVATMQQSLTDAIVAVNSTVGDIYDKTRDYEAACQNTFISLAELNAACEAGNLLDAIDAATSVAGANANIQSTSYVLSQIQGSRIPVLSNG